MIIKNLKNFIKNVFVKNLNGKKSRVICAIYSVGYIISLCLLGFYIYSSTVKLTIDPDISLSQTSIPAIEIPFPAITICSPQNVRSGLANVTDYYETFLGNTVKQLSVKEQNFMAAKAQVCTLAIHAGVDKGTQNRSERNVVKLLTLGSIDVNETFKRCARNYEKFECSKMMNKILTDTGICYSFNMQGHKAIFNYGISSDFDSYKRTKISKALNKSSKEYDEFYNDKDTIEHWTLENGYSSPQFNQIPYRATRHNNYQFYMTIKESDNYDLCYVLKGSYKIIIHLPNEIPTFFHEHEFLQFNNEGVFSLKATAYKSNANLAKYPLEKRGCYFKNERKLGFFKAFTQAQCNFECFTNFTLRRCGCVKYSMPRNQDTVVCDLDKAQCHMDAYNDWPQKDEKTKNPAMPCDCYPPCKNIKYEFKHSSKIPLNDENSIMVKVLRKKER